MVKLALAAWLPLSPDESYYWVWSQHLQLSYFDHPPLVAVLMGLGDMLPEWGRSVRWPAVLLGHLSLWFWADFFKGWFNERNQIWWLVLILFMPLTGPGSLIVTPDLPLMFSWSFILWSFHRLLNAENPRAWAPLFGVALGLGILSKYTVVLFGPIGLGWWWFQGRRPGLKSWLPITMIAALVVCAPVWLWNFQNDWASFRFQLNHGLGRKYWKPKWTYEYPLAQIALIFPTIFFLALRARAPRPWLLAAWFPLLFFFCTSFKGYVEVNWPLIAHPMVLALAVRQAGSRVWRWLAPAAVGWMVGFTLIICFLMMDSWPAWIERTKLRDLRAYDRLVQAANPYEPLYSRSYQTAAKLSYELKRPVYKLPGMNRFDFYDTLSESRPETDSFFLVVEAGDELPLPWDLWSKEVVSTVDEHFQILEVKRP